MEYCGVVGSCCENNEVVNITGQQPVLPPAWSFASSMAKIIGTKKSLGEVIQFLYAFWYQVPEFAVDSCPQGGLYFPKGSSGLTSKKERFWTSRESVNNEYNSLLKLKRVTGTISNSSKVRFGRKHGTTSGLI